MKHLYPAPVAPLVRRAIKLGWEIQLTKLTPHTVELVPQELTGPEYNFKLRWMHEPTRDRWVSPRAQSIETVREYLKRREEERKAMIDSPRRAFELAMDQPLEHWEAP